MTNQELNDLLARFEGSSLSKLKLSTQEFTIEMERARLRSRRAGDPGSGCCPGGTRRPPNPEGDAITAPMVGTFYAASGPGTAPLCAGGRPGTQGPARLPAGGHEDDERDPRPL